MKRQDTIWGFDAIDELIERHRIPQGGIAHKAMYGKGIIEGEKVILAKPLTYMNLSGDSLREFVNYYKLDPESEMIVLYDDIDLDPGQIRIRKKGSAGGHNGIKSIIAQLWDPELLPGEDWRRGKAQRLGSGGLCPGAVFIPGKRIGGSGHCSGSRGGGDDPVRGNRCGYEPL